MSKQSWFTRLFGSRSVGHSKQKSSFQPKLELLEDRLAPAIFSVTNENNAGAGSLRQAILNANASAGIDTIRFVTSDRFAKAFHIKPTSDLPVITSPINIDGTQIFRQALQFNFNRPMVEISGDLVAITGIEEGLHLNAEANGSTIRGLVINRFGDDGIAISGSNMVIQNCWIGVSFDGNSDAGNGAAGIRLVGGASNNLIGGPTAAQRNVISGQPVGIGTGGGAGTKLNNTIQGNFIGTNVAGTAAIGNNFGVYFTNHITGTLITNNVISGNASYGVALDGATVTATRIESNLIGLAANGVSPLGNGKFGVIVCDGSHDNDIGGIGVGNTFAFNGEVGVVIGSDPTNVVLDEPAGVGNSVLSNIFFSQTFFIDLGPNDRATPNDPLDADTGPNNLQNSTVLTTVVPAGTNNIVQGTLNSTPNSSFIIQIFASTLLDANGAPLNLSVIGNSSENTDAAGNVSYSIVVPAQSAGTTILATATNVLTGDTSEFNNQITVPNNPPMIRDDVLTPEINEGEKATLSGRLIDPDTGDKLHLIVNWGDGSPVQTYRPGLDPFTFKHRYDDDGVYNVNFTWIDNHGGSNTRTRQVVVHNVEPELRGLDLSREHPRVHQLFVLSGRIVDSGDDTFTLTVNWGDGTTETIERERDGEFRLKHRYHQAGLFTIHLTLTDDDGGITDKSLTIDVG